MSVFKNGKRVDLSDSNEDKNKMGGLFSIFKEGFNTPVNYNEEDTEDIDDEHEEEQEYSKITKIFKVLNTSFIGDCSDTYKTLILEEISTKKRYYLEFEIYEFDEEDDSDIMDLITLISGDKVEIEFDVENLEVVLDIDDIIKAECIVEE